VSADRPSVLVAVGTDHHPFDRLIRWADAWASRAGSADVFVQYGTAAPPATAAGSDYVSHDELERRMREAVAVVCHGGPGTIVDALRSGHTPIVVPRRRALGEHVDDHQVRFTRRLAAAGYAHVAGRSRELAALLDRAVAGDPAFAAPPTEDEVKATTARFAAIVDDLVRPRTGVRILYVGGWGRSGSTLLDRLLGQVPGAFSVGEMRDIWLRGVIEDRRCGCGEPFGRCPFWTEVGERAFGGWRVEDARELHRLRRRYDRPWMVPMLATRLFRTRGFRRYLDATGRVYSAIAEVSGARVIVDSTKIPSYALALRRLPGVDLRFVHLVRDSRGVVHSWKKDVMRADASDAPDRMLRYGAASASGRYVLYNWTSGLLGRSRTPYLFVRYEDLVADVPATLRGILSFAGLGDASLGFVSNGGVTLEANHSVDGNPMRFATGELPIRADEEWRSKMDERDRRTVSALTRPLLRRYGYR
jgi:UDP-N-acetylglucosamine transferase subunit ALG13